MNNSYAGFFESVLNVKSNKLSLIESAINKVFGSYKKNNSLKKSEVIVQLMIKNVSMSGVIFTKDINTGAPYYVVNYDDETGRTDTVTAGTDYNNRSLYIYRNSKKHLKSKKRFVKLINAVKEIEKVTNSKNLDIEFATDFSNKVFIFQIRPITTSAN